MPLKGVVGLSISYMGCQVDILSRLSIQAGLVCKGFTYLRPLTRSMMKSVEFQGPMIWLHIPNTALVSSNRAETI